MLHVVLFNPEIPQNTGNIGRLCAFTGSRLHLIHPLGFELSNRYLKRSGLDYWPSLDLREYRSWKAFEEASTRPRRIWLFTTKSRNCFWDVDFGEDDGLLFGNEGSGAPPWLHGWVGEARRLNLPRCHGAVELRSLNLATCVAVALYEALRQTRTEATGRAKRPR